MLHDSPRPTSANSSRAALRGFGRSGVIVVLAILVLLVSQPAAEARVRLEDICTVYGQKEVRLTGVGLVVGLNKTGDGGKNLPSMRALAAALSQLDMPISGLAELRDADNVAVVMIEATVPKTGIRRGQKIDCYVSSFMGAKSLRGGRLLIAPLRMAEVNSDTLVGLASGPVYLEDASVPTNGTIPGGVLVEQDFYTFFVDNSRGHTVTLLLNEQYSSFHASSEVARLVNAEFEHETGNEQLARAIGPGVVEVRIPEEYREYPVEFVAEMMRAGIDNPSSQARVVVNVKSGTVVVTGEVEISPVVISHPNLTVEIGQEQFPGAGGAFVDLLDQAGRQSPQQLRHLVTELNKLRVPKEDVISIIRELHRSGKLHAEYDEH